MKRLTRVLIAGCILALPFGASAENDAAAYCTALSDKYTRYVHNPNCRMTAQPNVSISLALSKCRSEPADAIPTLEQALRNAKVDLPPRG